MLACSGLALAKPMLMVTCSGWLPAAYPHYKKILQMLQYQDNLIGANTPKRWVMKGPLHLFDTKALGQTFPDAQLVW